MFALLRNREFARLLAGRLVTNAGDSLYYVAAMWLVYDLSGSPFYTGVAGFLVLAPQALQFLTGPLVDRWPLRRTLVWTQVAQGLLVLLIPLAAWVGALSHWVVLAVMPVVSMLNQFVYPAQSAALPRIVDDDELVAANSAFSFAYQGVDMAFTAAGGLLLVAVGGVALYLVDSVTFAAAALLFATLRVPGRRDGDAAGSGMDAGAATVDPDARTVTAGATAVDDDATAVAADGGESVVVADSAFRAYRRELREGVDYLRGTVLLPMMVTGLVANGTLGGVTAALPAYADLLGGAETYGVLLAAISAGVLVGALLATRFEGWPLGRLSVVGYAAGATCWLGALASPWFPGTVALLFLAFVPVGVTNVVFGAMVQRLVPDDLLGRVSSVGASGGTLMMPVGALTGGWLAATAGALPVMVVGAAGMAFIAVYVVAVPSLRRLPRVAEMETLERDAPSPGR
ncbi:MFS transporter [Halobium salinum]|uniref:MFS transporter n=1 Tax=Halobium salinum TaxID=1364940 RepID=A0ABD5PF91_9EURY|nr:MFS transporter [Halobium salinum]